ncbi:MAG: aldo/keto reductase [Dehalococcoidia bacterium]
MKYRKFGNTGLELSELCFGPMRFAEKTPGDDERSQEGMRALHAALDGGVNVIHSSGEYGTRWALNKALANHPKRNDLHHIIKVQTPDYEDDGFDASELISQVEHALKDLHTDCIDIVQHLQRGPRTTKEDAYGPEGDPARIGAMPSVNEAMLETFERLREQGKVGYLTTFPHTVGFAKAALESGAFSGMVHFYNLLETEMAQFFPEFEKKGMGFIGIRPVLQGMLTDKRINRSTLPDDDARKGSGWDQWYALLDAVRAELESMGEKPGSWTSYAMKFSLAHPAVTTVVAGINSQSQAEELIAACDGNYPDTSVVEAVQRVTASLPEIRKETIFG